MKMIKIGDLFEVTYGTKFDMNKMAISEKSSIAFISRSSKNNGLVAHVDKYNNTEPLPSGLITVTLGGTYVLSSFLQEAPFYTAQNVAVLKAKQPMSNTEKLYYCMCIAKNRYRYGAFGREANSTIRDILVPHSDEIPSFVNRIDVNQFENVSDPVVVDSSIILTNPIFWKDFTYDQLFTIQRGDVLIGAYKNITGDIPLVSSSEKNNGVSVFTQTDKPFCGNVITVSNNGTIGEAFYQEKSFIATADVNILTPKFELNKYIVFFLLTLIRLEKPRYNYGRKWNLEKMKKSIIKLPINEAGEPDWQFMEDYIKSLPYSGSI